MNTYDLTKELVSAFLKSDRNTGEEILDQLYDQAAEEFPKDSGVPIIPEDVFLLLNTPELRGIAYFSFLRSLDSTL